MFKKFFIPNKSNNFRPKSLQKFTVSTILIVVLVLEFFTITFLINPQFASKITNLSAIIPSALIAKANRTRENENLGELKENSTLKEAALLKAQSMASKGYFSHIDPDGNQPWHYLDLAGYKYQAAGENLAVNFADSSEVHKAWMNSPTHKANIVQPKFTEIGIATADGLYKGKEAIFVVEYFAVPKEGIDFMALKQNNDVPLAVNSESKVLGAFTEKIYASPRTTISYILIALSLLVLISLVLKVTFAKHIQYKDLIFNGILLLLIIISAIAINYLSAGYFGEIAMI